VRLAELRTDWKAVTAIVVSTLLLVIDAYHRIFAFESLDRLVLGFGVPLFVIVVVFRKSPSEYGLRLGDWKAGLALTAAGWIGVTVLMAVVARTASFQAYYGSRSGSPLELGFSTAVDMLGWEFLFRGFLLFALYPLCGPVAIVLQAVPFALAHVGKPELETLSTIFGGSAFGYVAWRTRSFVYPFLIHWLLSVLTVLFAGGAAG